MSTGRRLHYSYADYLRALAGSELKLEYYDGVIYAMAGGTPEHAELAARAIAKLSTALDECRIYTSGLKVFIEATGLATFPDASVVCGDRKTASVDANALTNPVLLVEVTSPSTVDSDRGDKLSHYKQIPSLRAVLLVSHSERRITVIQRADAGWTERDFRGGETATVREPLLELSVDELYRGVAIPAPTP